MVRKNNTKIVIEKTIIKKERAPIIPSKVIKSKKNKKIKHKKKNLDE